MTKSGTSASDLVSARLRDLRKQRGWTAQQLAERCAEAGAPQLTASVIANIETGRRDPDGRRRRDVSIDEVLVLACVLGAPPARLVLPIGADERLDVTPAVSVGPFRAMLWITARLPLPGDRRAWDQAYKPMRLYQSFFEEFEAAARHENRGQTAGFEHRLQMLALVINLIAGNDQEVPPLPQEWITHMLDAGWLETDVKVPVFDEARDGTHYGQR